MTPRARLCALLTVAALLAACGVLERGERKPGGDTTNTLLFGRNAFSRHVSNITPEHEPLFFSGNAFFNQPWVQAPASTAGRDGLGPLFNARSCAGCHLRDGRGAPPASGERVSEAQPGLLIRLSVPGEGPHGGPLPEPNYGDQLQPFGVDGVPGEAVVRLELHAIEGRYEDGQPYILLEPRYILESLAYGSLSDAVMRSPRVAPQVIGVGLLEAIPESRLEALADPADLDGDGVSGRLQRVWDAEAGALRPGRFGWKGDAPTIRQQVAGAFLGDIGITSPVFHERDCQPAQRPCAEAQDGGAPEISPENFHRVVAYTSLLAVPARRAPEDPEVLEGRALFHDIGCAACHVPTHVTGEAVFEELEGQIIWPYTDLLLHDMGEGLADGRPVFEASGQEWRTPPLWGIGLLSEVNDHMQLLHDGRARGVAEAILWHGGEAESSREAFRGLSAAERAALVRFVESL